MMTTQGGLKIIVGISYPGGAPHLTDRKGSLVAFCWFRLEDGHGFELFIKSSRLKVDDFGNYFLSLPAEARTAPCPECRRENKDHVNYCNWCGRPLKPAGRKGWFMDIVCPSNNQTRSMLVQAAVAEHKRLQAEYEQSQNQSQQGEPEPVR